MDVFKCIHCGGTKLGGFRFDATVRLKKKISRRLTPWKRKENEDV